MPYERLILTAVVAVAVVISIVTHMQTDWKRFDPYSQGVKVGKEFDPYQQDAKAGNKFDLYPQGANKNGSTTSALDPDARPVSVEKGKYDVYTQGAKVGNKFNLYSQGAKADGKFDLYNEGANGEDTSRQ